MSVEVYPVPFEGQGTLINLVKFYCYEWSQYTGMEVNEKGEYGFEHHIPNFWKLENHCPFFIKVDGKLAGFILIDNDFDEFKDADYAVSEFFVMHKYRRNGTGRCAALDVFNRFHGKWEIKMHPRNDASIRFWHDIVREYTDNDYVVIDNCKNAMYMDGSLGSVISFSK